MQKIFKKFHLFTVILFVMLLVSAVSINIVWGWTAPNGNPPTGTSNQGLYLLNGNIGIGTSTPAYALTASGTIYASGGYKFSDGTTQTTAFSGVSQTMSSANISSGAFGSNTGGGNYSFPASLSVGTSTAPTGGVAIFNGNVSIATTTSVYPLTITGDVNITGSYRVNGTPFSGSSQWTTSSTAIYYNSGNVGIGTTNPGALLSLGTGSGQKLYVYDAGGTGVKAGFGVDLSGSSRELSIFNSTSDGATGDISFGRRLESSGAYTENVRVQSNGNVGIGTATPGYKLEVNGTFKAAASTFYGDVTVNKGDSLGGNLRFTGHGFLGSADWGDLTLAAGTNAGIAQINFQTEGATKMTIFGNGNVGIGGGPNPVSKLAVGGAGVSAAGIYGTITGKYGIGVYGRAIKTGVEGSGDTYGVIGTASAFMGAGVYGTSIGASGFGVYGVTSDATSFGVYCMSTSNVNGCGGNRAWYNSSDVRLKENISTIPDALPKVMQLRGVDFTWKSDSKKTPQLGFIAQEAMEVVPEAVGKDPDGYYTMSYGNIVPLLVEAVKQQQKEIEDLKTEINLLEK